MDGLDDEMVDALTCARFGWTLDELDSQPLPFVRKCRMLAVMPPKSFGLA